MGQRWRRLEAETVVGLTCGGSQEQEALSGQWAELPALPVNLVARLTLGSCWSGLTALLIVVNALFTGLEAHLRVKAGLSRSPIPAWLDDVNTMFTVVFTLELVCRITGEQAWFFRGPHWCWNLFDMVLVLTSLVQEISSVSTVNFIRVFRLFRILRSLRILHLLRLCRGMRQFVYSIATSLAGLAWATLLLLLVTYLFSICVLHSASQFMEEVDPTGAEDDPYTGFATWFNGLGGTLLSLILTVTGGANWYDIAKPLIQINWWNAVSFVIYIVFVSFGMVSVLVGIITTGQANHQREEVLANSSGRAFSKEGNFVSDLRESFGEADETAEGESSRQAVLAERFQTHLSAHSVDTLEAKSGLKGVANVRSAFAANCDEMEKVIAVLAQGLEAVQEKLDTLIAAQRSVD